MNTMTKRGVQALAFGVAATAVAAVPSGAYASEATDASTAQTCYVSTINVPYYNIPPLEGGKIVGWVNKAGTRFDVKVRDGYWRGGTVAGGPPGVFIHSNYLNC